MLGHDWKSKARVPTANHGTEEALLTTLLVLRWKVHLFVVPGAGLANLDASEE